MTRFIFLIPLLPLLGFVAELRVRRPLDAAAARPPRARPRTLAPGRRARRARPCRRTALMRPTPTRDHGASHAQAPGPHRHHRLRHRAAVVPRLAVRGLDGASRAGPHAGGDAVDLAARRGGGDGGGRGPVRRRLGLPGGSAVLGDAAGRDLRRLLDPRVLHGVHEPRPRLRPLHGVPEPVHVRDAHPRPRRELPDAVRGLGRGRPLLVPAHRVLVRPQERVRRGQEGLHRQPHRRRRLRARHVPHLRHLRQPGLPDGDRSRRGDARGVGLVGRGSR